MLRALLLLVRNGKRQAAREICPNPLTPSLRMLDVK